MRVVLTGTNKFAIANEQHMLVSEFKRNHGDGVERFDGTKLSSADPVLNAVRSISLLEPTKMVIVRDFSQSSDLMNSIEVIYEQAADTTDLLLIDSRLDKRTKGYKYLQKNFEIRIMKELAPFELDKWIVGYVKDLSGTITPKDAQYLAERVGPNQLLLSSEIKKLLLASSTINQENIDLLVDPTPQSKIFTMLEELFRGHGKLAWKLYLDQIAQGEQPQKILAMITG